MRSYILAYLDRFFLMSFVLTAFSSVTLFGKVTTFPLALFALSALISVIVDYYITYTFKSEDKLELKTQILLKAILYFVAIASYSIASLDFYKFFFFTIIFLFFKSNIEVNLYKDLKLEFDEKRYLYSFGFLGLDHYKVHIQKHFKEAVSTEKAPKAIGPYSQAVLKDGYLYISGQLPINPETGNIPKNFKNQVKQALENIKNILESVDMDLNNVLQVGVFLKDLEKFSQFNEVYEKYFSEPYPSRYVVQVSQIPKNAEIEIFCIAKK